MNDTLQHLAKEFHENTVSNPHLRPIETELEHFFRALLMDRREEAILAQQRISLYLWDPEPDKPVADAGSGKGAGGSGTIKCPHCNRPIIVGSP